MSPHTRTLSIFALFAVSSAFAYQSDLLASIKVQQTTLADEIRAYKLMNIPPNSTGSCKSRFGDGAQAGKLDCECKGGYMWNQNKTECVSDGTPQALSYFDRLTMRISRLWRDRASEAVAPASPVPPAPPAVVQKKNPLGCVVKADITDKGDKYYVVPGCPSYDDVEIDLSKNEKRFCSEELAEKAGWKKSPACD